MERYPFITGGGEIKGFTVSGGDFTALYNPDGKRIGVYMWVTVHRAVRIDQYLHSGLLVLRSTRGGELRIDVERYLEDIPWPLAYFSRGGLEGYTGWLDREIGDQVEGRRVLVNFSGGKDSTAVLAVLSKLAEKRRLKVTAIYSHVPFIEPEENLDFAEKAAEKLGAEFVAVEADRRIFEKRLREEGLPYRGWRWCTYLKLKPIKKYRKEVKPDYSADGDRMAEAFKRYKRLVSMSPKKPRIISGTRIKPIYILTLADIARLVRETGLIHPDYLQGFPRVACHLCPYITPHELELVSLDRLEDPGLVEEALRATHRRDYSDIPWEDFVERALWRHHPRPARIILEASRLLEKNSQEEVTARAVNNRYRSLWVNPLPRLPEAEPEDSITAHRETVGLAFEALAARIKNMGEEEGETVAENPL